jgi:hypothetical protein
VQKIRDDIETLGGAVLVVTFATPPQLTAFERDNPLPFPIVSDPERKAYLAFSIGSTSAGALLRPNVIWHYLKLMLRGWWPKRPAEDADIWQLGGDFILDRAGRLIYAHPSKDPADRPGNDVLLAELRNAAQSGSG